MYLAPESFFFQKLLSSTIHYSPLVVSHYLFCSAQCCSFFSKLSSLDCSDQNWRNIMRISLLSKQRQSARDATGECFCQFFQTTSLRGAGGKRHQILSPSAWNLLLGSVNSSAVLLKSSGDHQEVFAHRYFRKSDPPKNQTQTSKNSHPFKTLETTKAPNHKTWRNF